MAHFAEISPDNNTVTRVLSVHDMDAPRGQDFLANELGLGGTWIQTSYNSNIRKQFAGIDYTYDSAADVFITPRPFLSWVLDTNHDWQPPTPMPTDGYMYAWDETNQKWQLN